MSFLVVKAVWRHAVRAIEVICPEGHRADVDWTGGTQVTDLRALVAAGDPALQEALDLAGTMSVSAVEQQLDWDFRVNYAEDASRFLRAWLPRLRPFERMQAAEWVTSEYILSMVHLDHAYGIGARLQLEALAAAAERLADALDSFGAFTDGPDAEVDLRVTTTLHGLAATVYEVSARLSTEVAALPPTP